MKKKYLSSTRLIVYLTELPLIILFVITLRYNKYSEQLTKFYPLMIFIGALMIFILIYFFRAISISFSEIRYHGFFSSRDHAEINEGKDIIITMLPKRVIKVALFGNDNRTPELSWIQEDENYKPMDIFLFRGTAYGTKKKVISVLKYFGVSESDIPLVFETESFSAEYEFVSLNSKMSDEKTEIKLKMKQTV